MKMKQSAWLLLLIMSITAFSLSSCVTDNAREAEWNLAGDWKVTKVWYDDNGRAPYRRGDVFSFYTNDYQNTFETWGYYDNYYERGVWRIESDGWDNYRLVMSFDGYNASIYADMSDFPDDNIITLRVDDAEYGRYYLTLKRQY